MEYNWKWCQRIASSTHIVVLQSQKTFMVLGYLLSADIMMYIAFSIQTWIFWTSLIYSCIHEYNNYTLNSEIYRKILVAFWFLVFFYPVAKNKYILHRLSTCLSFIVIATAFPPTSIMRIASHSQSIQKWAYLCFWTNKLMRRQYQNPSSIKNVTSCI